MVVAHREGNLRSAKLLSSSVCLCGWWLLTQHNQSEGSDGGACQESDSRQIIRCQVNESMGS